MWMDITMKTKTFVEYMFATLVINMYVLIKSSHVAQLSGTRFFAITVIHVVCVVAKSYTTPRYVPNATVLYVNIIVVLTKIRIFVETVANKIFENKDLLWNL